MKRFIQIHRNDPAGDIPNDALKSVLFKLSTSLFGKALSTTVQAAPSPFHREIVNELIEMYFDNFPENHVLIELQDDPPQRPIPVGSDVVSNGTSVGHAMSAIFGQAHRVPPRVVSVPSSTRNMNHFVTFNESNQPESCTCEAFTYRGECKHLEQAKRL